MPVFEKRKEIRTNSSFISTLWKKLFMHFLVCWTKESLRNRENTRFRRSMMYGLLRKILHSIGKKLKAQGIIECERDLFYLTIEELLALNEGTAVSTLMKDLIQARKENYHFYKTLVLPDRSSQQGSSQRILIYILKKNQI